MSLHLYPPGSLLIRPRFPVWTRESKDLTNVSAYPKVRWSPTQSVTWPFLQRQCANETKVRGGMGDWLRGLHEALISQLSAASCSMHIKLLWDRYIHTLIAATMIHLLPFTDSKKKRNLYRQKSSELYLINRCSVWNRKCHSYESWSKLQKTGKGVKTWISGVSLLLHMTIF